jgi:hypothetical protein
MHNNIMFCPRRQPPIKHQHIQKLVSTELCEYTQYEIYFPAASMYISILVMLFKKHYNTFHNSGRPLRLICHISRPSVTFEIFFNTRRYSSSGTDQEIPASIWKTNRTVSSAETGFRGARRTNRRALRSSYSIELHVCMKQLRACAIAARPRPRPGRHNNRNNPDASTPCVHVRDVEGLDCAWHRCAESRSVPKIERCGNRPSQCSWG